jgi:DUF917 family protein
MMRELTKIETLVREGGRLIVCGVIKGVARRADGGQLEGDVSKPQR